jgi:hypothetical protein
MIKKDFTSKERVFEIKVEMCDSDVRVTEVQLDQKLSKPSSSLLNWAILVKYTLKL